MSRKMDSSMVWKSNWSKFSFKLQVFIAKKVYRSNIKTSFEESQDCENIGKS